MNEKNTALPGREDVLDNEAALLRGLIEASRFKEEMRQRVEIKRNSKPLFGFMVRALGEEEIGQCQHKATKLYPNPAGRKLPPIEGPVDWVKYRSWKIYMATVDEDKARIWDNKKFQEQFGVLSGVDLVDQVLRAGDKESVCDVIDGLNGDSGQDEVSLEDYAKN